MTDNERLRAENQALEFALEREREDGKDQRTELTELRAENERLTKGYDWSVTRGKIWQIEIENLQAEIGRLRAVLDTAREFLRWHERGQPGTPDTLYPMTYGQLDEWHAEWDRRLQALADAFSESYQSA